MCIRDSILKDYGLFEVDQIWNLVLTCRECNRGSRGKFEKIPKIYYLEALNRRNNFYIESHHPLRETIINQTGKTDRERRDFLQKMFNNAVSHVPIKWEPSEIFGESI